MENVFDGHVSSFFGGVGLRPKHYASILENGAGSVQWFEAISENFMDTQGRPRQILRKMRERYPLALHGVGMSLGSVEGLSQNHLLNLRALIKEIEPMIVSDHLCWNKLGNHYTHDLLPVEYTRESMEGLIRNISSAQEFLGRQILVENISAYVHSENAEFQEAEFIVQVAKTTGCKLLLDINNVYVNAVNFGYSAQDFLDAIPAELIGQVHLAGYSDMGSHLFDTHSRKVQDPVWKLYEQTIPKLAGVPVLIEWDDDLPQFSDLERELLKARSIWQKSFAEQLLKTFYDSVVSTNEAPLSFRPAGKLTLEQAFEVYRTGYNARLTEALGDTYEDIWRVLGDEIFFKTCRDFIRDNPSQDYNLENYSPHFAQYLSKQSYVSDFPFLPDLAKLAWMRKEVFAAAEMSAMPSEELLELVAEDQPCELIAACRIFQADYNVVQISRALATDAEPTDDWLKSTAVLLVRQNFSVVSLEITLKHYAAFKLLREGNGLLECCEDLDQAEVAEWFTLLSARGLVRARPAS